VRAFGLLVPGAEIADRLSRDSGNHRFEALLAAPDRAGRSRLGPDIAVRAPAADVVEALPQAFERCRVRHGQGVIENANDDVGRTSFGQLDDEISAAVELAAQPLQPAPRAVGEREAAVADG
jgi:hypothetical protein